MLVRADDLTPAALGYKFWTGLHVIIVNYELGIVRLDSVAQAIESALRSVGVSSQIFAPTHQTALDGKRPRLAVLLTSEASAGVAKEAKTLVRMLHRIPTILVHLDAQAVVPAGVVFDHEIDAHGRDPKVVAADVASAVDATRVHGKA